jgi:hypothetical protein
MLPASMSRRKLYTRIELRLTGRLHNAKLQICNEALQKQAIRIHRITDLP